MKKIILSFVAVIALILGTTQVYAEEYTSTGLKETLEAEKIDLDADYEESDNQAVIYLFRGSGCSHCAEFLTFLSSIVEDYGKYFRLEAYEVWSDSANANLMSDVADFLDVEANGVPFIVIGEKVYSGYSSSYDDEIKEAIMDLYESSDRYDVLEAMEEAENTSSTESSTSSSSVIGWTLVFVVVATIIIICHINKKFNELVDMLDNAE